MSKGLHVLGAVPSWNRSHRGSMRARTTHADVFTSPRKVVVSPHHAGSTVFEGTVAQVIVQGGAPSTPRYDRTLTFYEAPTVVSVTLVNGSTSTFKGPDAVQVYGGDRSDTLLGADPAPALDAGAGKAGAGSADPYAPYIDAASHLAAGITSALVNRPPPPPPQPPPQGTNPVWYVGGAAVLAIVVALLVRSRG